MASFTEQDMKHSDTEQDKRQFEARKKDIPCNNSDEKFRYIYIRYDHLSDSQNAYEVIPENGELFTQFVNGNRNLYELNTVKRKEEPEIPDQAISCFNMNTGKGRNEIFYPDGSICMYYYPSDYESDYDILYNAIKQINGIRKKPELSDLIIFRNKMNSAYDITMSRINTAIVRNKVSSVSLPIMSLLNLNMGEWENESYVTTLIDHTQEDWERHDPSVCVYHSIMHTLGAWHMHNIVNTCITIDKEIGEKGNIANVWQGWGYKPLIKIRYDDTDKIIKHKLAKVKKFVKNPVTLPKLLYKGLRNMHHEVMFNKNIDMHNYLLGIYMNGVDNSNTRKVITRIKKLLRKYKYNNIGVYLNKLPSLSQLTFP